MLCPVICHHSDFLEACGSETRINVGLRQGWPPLSGSKQNRLASWGCHLQSLHSQSLHPDVLTKLSTTLGPKPPPDKPVGCVPLLFLPRIHGFPSKPCGRSKWRMAMIMCVWLSSSTKRAQSPLSAIPNPSFPHHPPGHRFTESLPPGMAIVN